MTGSKYLVTHKGRSVLVDCGLFQGLKSLRQQNWDNISIDPSTIDAIILTHAHIDHSGFIPRLINDGYKGKIYCTEATKDLCRILLPDAGYLMEEEAAFLNKHKRTKHHPALPLFTQKDAEWSIHQFETLPFHSSKAIGNFFEIEFMPVGHILGAASLILKAGSKRIAFSGDVGRPQDPLLPPPERLPKADYLVVESTYGNRLHGQENAKEELRRIINLAFENKGVVLIPSFAVGRTQTILHFLAQLKVSQQIPNVPIFLNSPMALQINGLMDKYIGLHKLSKEQCAEIKSAIQYVKTADESKELNRRRGPMVIVAGSGMMEGGRILHHLKEFAPHSSNWIVLTGFQAAGTRGEALQRGAEKIKIHGEFFPVKAKVETLNTLSAHADYSEMIDWLKASKLSPRKVFVTHGESSASTEFSKRLTETLGWSCTVPNLDDTFSLD